MSFDGSSPPWIAGQTIPQTLAATVARFPERDAVVFPKLDLRWSWQQFAAEVEQAARGLWGLGIRRGEHVAVWATNVPEWIVLQQATAQLGAVQRWMLVPKGVIAPGTRARPLLPTNEMTGMSTFGAWVRFSMSRRPRPTESAVESRLIAWEHWASAVACV